MRLGWLLLTLFVLHGYCVNQLRPAPRGTLYKMHPIPRAPVLSLGVFFVPFRLSSVVHGW